MPAPSASTVELHDAAGGGSKKYQIPQGLKKLLEEISGQVLRKQPDTGIIYEFIADYLERKLRGDVDDNEPSPVYKTDDGKVVKIKSDGTLVYDDGTPVPPGTKLHPLEGKPSNLDTDMQKKLQLFTTDGRPIKYTPSGQIVTDKGEILPPGTALVSKDGKQFRKNTRGSIYDARGLPVFLTAGGDMVTMNEDGTLVDSKGRPIPPGTKIFTPKGEEIGVNSTGKPVPVGKDEDRYATVIQAAFRGHLARKGRSSKDDDSKKQKMYDANGKEVMLTPSGRILDSAGRVLPSTTKLFTQDGKEVPNPIYKTADGKVARVLPDGTIVDANGKPLPPGTKLFTASGKEVPNPVYKTADGKTVRVTPSGTIIDADGKPVPSGTKLFTPDGKELSDPVYKTADGKTVKVLPDGTIVDSNGKALPSGTKLFNSSGKEVPNPVYKTADGKTVRVTPSGTIIDADGKPVPSGTKLFTPDGKELSDPVYKTADGKTVKVLPDGTIVDSNGKALPSGTKLFNSSGKEVPNPVYKTADGKTVRVTPSGTIIDADGKPVPSGTKLFTPDGKELSDPVYKTADGKTVKVLPDGTIVDSNGKALPSGTKLFNSSGKEVPNPVYKTADGKTVRVTPSGTIIGADGKPVPSGTKLFTPDGKELSDPVYKTADGKTVKVLPDGTIVDSNGKALPPGTKLFNSSGKEVPNAVYKTEDGRTVRQTPSGNLIDEDGKRVPLGTKLFTPDGKELSSPAYTTEDGKAVRVKSDGSLVYADGTPVPAGTKMTSFTGKPVVADAPNPVYTTADGKTVKVLPDGTIVDSNGKPLPPGTKLFNSSGKEVPNPVLKTADGRILRVTPSGSLIDADGKPVPQGTKLFTPDGKEMSKPPFTTEDGKAVRVKADGSLVYDDGSPVPPGTKMTSFTGQPTVSGSQNPVYQTADGKIVKVLPDGTIVDLNGRPLPPGTKLFTGSGKEVPNPVYVTEDGRTVRVTPSGSLIDSNGKPVAPGTKLLTPDGKQMSSPAYTTEDGKAVKVKPDGTLVYADGTPVPPGTKLTSFTGQPVIVSSAGGPVPQESIHAHVDKVLSKALDLVGVLENLEGQVADATRQPESEWLTNYWSTHNMPHRLSQPGDSSLNEMADALNFVLAEEDSMGPIEAFIAMIQRAIDGLMGKLSGADPENSSRGDQPQNRNQPGQSDTMSPESTIVLDTAMQKKLQLFTTDGRPIKYTPSGQIITDKGEILPPGTKLLSKDGQQFRRNTRGSIYDARGLPVFLTEDGRLVEMKEDGTLVDSSGRTIPPGEKLFTPKGEEINVNPAGKPVPVGKDEDRYATVIQAAFRGHLVRKGRLSKEDGSKKPLIGKDGEQLQSSAAKPSKLFDENGKEVMMTPSGHILDANGKVLPPGTKLRTASNKELSISPNGTIYPPTRRSGSKLYTADGRPVMTTDSGHYVLENGQPLPPGTKIKISGSREMIISPSGGLQEDRPPQERKRSGRMFTEDGLEIEASPSGRVLTVSGTAAPEDTKIKTIDLRNIISGDGTFPETNLFAEDGTAVVVTSSGRVFTVQGKELFPGALLRTSDNRIMTVSPSGGVVLRPTSSVPGQAVAAPRSKSQSPSGRKVEGTQSGGALNNAPNKTTTTPSGKVMETTPSGRPVASSSNPTSSSRGNVRKLFTEEGEEIWMDSAGKILNKDGEEIHPSHFVTPSGKLVDATKQTPSKLAGISGGGTAGAPNDMLTPPAAIIADMVRRNTAEGMLSEEQADPEGVMIEWASTVDEFMTDQISTIEGLLSGNIPLREARGTIIFLTVSFVVGLVVGYGIARSLGIIGPPRSSQVRTGTSSIANLNEIGSMKGPDSHQLHHGVVDPVTGKCIHK